MCLLSYAYGYTAERIKSLVSHGADVEDPRVRQTLIRLPSAMEMDQIGMTEESFELLTGLGIPITKEDFPAVDPKNCRMVLPGHG